jgi:hypothetical protein
VELTPVKLISICAALFGGIVAINMIAQYRDNEQVKESFAKIDFSALRTRLRREEGLPMLEIPDDANDEQLLLRED